MKLRGIFTIMASVAATIALSVSPAAGESATQAAEPNCNFISDSARPTLYIGDSGAAVRQVQCLINNYSAFPAMSI